MESTKAKLTEGSVGRHLVDMTVPILFGITMMMAQSIIDAWFLGKVGDRALAAFSFGFPILMVITSVAIGLGAGPTRLSFSEDAAKRFESHGNVPCPASPVVTRTWAWVSGSRAGVGVLRYS